MTIVRKLAAVMCALGVGAGLLGGVGAASAQDEVVPSTAGPNCYGLSPFIVDIPFAADLEVAQSHINIRHGQPAVYVRTRSTLYGRYDVTTHFSWVNTTRKTRGGQTVTGAVGSFFNNNIIGLSYGTTGTVPTGVGLVDFAVTMDLHGPVPVPSVRCTARFAVA